MLLIAILADGPGTPEAITSGFFDLVLEEWLTRDWVELWEKAFYGIVDAFASVGAPYAARPAQPAPALPLSVYTGTYAND